MKQNLVSYESIPSIQHMLIDNGIVFERVVYKQANNGLLWNYL